MTDTVNSIDELKETKEDKALRLLGAQMRMFHDRVEVLTAKARQHAAHLPTGEAEMYAAYVEKGCQHMTAAFNARQSFPTFGSTGWDAIDE